MSGADVLDLIDRAPAFADVVEDPAIAAEAVRRFGLAELDARLAPLRTAAGDNRQTALATAAEQIGQLVAAGALDEKFARAVIEDAAAKCGMIRDDGARAAKSAIVAAIKLGKK